MAEIALPVLALGALYMMSNQDKNSKKEPFNNMNSNNNYINHLPNTSVPDPNYPLPTRVVEDDSIDLTSENAIRQYNNPNQTTDKFFNNKIYENTANQKTNWGVGDGLDGGSKNTNVYSLTGEKVKQSDFKHNNMVPFFGAKIRGATVDANITESILDNYQGAGNTWPKKVEQAPLFKPQQNMQWNSGMPNYSDFYESRVNPSSTSQNAVPWSQEKIAPGLGMGYGTQGGPGYNSAVMSRESWLPYSVDQLRVATNPKMTYGLEGHQGPAMAGGTSGPQMKAELIGKVEKFSPDTDYKVGPERWFTTTGQAMGPTLSAAQTIKDGTRQETTREHFGSGVSNQNVKAAYLKGYYEPSNRPELQKLDIKPMSAPGHGSPHERDFGAKGFNMLKNNRSVNCETCHLDNNLRINNTIKAMVSPILDILRPSRKEELIDNPNQSGNIQTTVPALPITNPNDMPKTTIKETTVNKLGYTHLNGGYLSVPEGGYLATSTQIKYQQRDTTNCPNIGNPGPIGSGSSQHSVEPMSTIAYYNQHNNVNKTYENWPMPGGNRNGLGALNSSVNIHIDKKEVDRENNRMWVPEKVVSNGITGAAGMPNVENYGKINMPQYYNECMNCDRISPDVLLAFKNNPYAQSLASVGPVGGSGS